MRGHDCTVADYSEQMTDEQIAAMRDLRLAGTVKLPTIEDAVKAGGFLAGRRTSSSN